MSLSRHRTGMCIFLCHASEDKPGVRTLAKRLRADGFDPWMDEERLLPGQDWDAEISKAVAEADAVLVCLSSTSVDKVGYVQKELRRLLDIAEYQPDGRVFLIPVRLENCAIPARLSRYQYADLFAEDGYQRLRAGLKAAKFGRTAQALKRPPPPLEPARLEGRSRVPPRLAIASVLVL